MARTALAGAPDNPFLHLALARALSGAGRLDVAESSIRLALGRAIDHEELYEELAHVLARRDKVEAALECARGRHGPWAPVFAFKLLIRQGRPEEAAAFEQEVGALRAADPDLFAFRVKRSRNDPQRALQLCDEVLGRDPGAAHALYHKIVALAQLGRDEEAAALMGLDRLLSIGVLPTPPGFGTDEAFREVLRDEILANPTLIADPAGHATRAGLRTRTFPAAGDRAAAKLVGGLRTAIEQYAEAWPGGHPFVEAMPAAATMSQWALLFRGGGHQTLHHHPGVWITGVYYVSARRDVAGRAAPKASVIRLGGLPAWAGIAAPWPELEIQPVPGMVLLFPSHVPHETVPPGDGTERISVAFDVSPAPPPGPLGLGLHDLAAEG